MSSKDDKFIEDIRQQLDQSLDELDVATRSRLTQARAVAVERGARRQYRLFYWAALPAAGLALALLLLNVPSLTGPQLLTPEITLLPMLTAAEPLDFYQEEIEFYEWLSEVMDTEQESSDLQRTFVEPDTADRVAGTTGQRDRTAQLGNARVSGDV